MAEHDPWRHLQETVSCNLGTCELVDPEVLEGTPHKGRIARRLGSRYEE